MQVKIGEKIKELRQRDGRTQNALAKAVGVTSQAVCRWESGGSYPDIEALPSIANYFGISIDELFGYQNDRDKKVEAIIQKIESFHIESRGDDEWVDECLGILREGVAEFPQNERLLITLANTLSEAGWRRHCEWLYYDQEGYIQHDYDRHKKNPYWAEAVEICENLANNASDHTIATKAISILVLLYRNFGETKQAIACANRMPELKRCREVLLAAATDGKEEAKYVGDLLLKLASKFAEQMVYGLVANLNHYTSDMPIEKIQGAIDLFYLVCDDGNLGEYHGKVMELFLYLSRLQWERGYHDDAFHSLDEALRHARASEALRDGKEHSYTAPLVSLVKYNLGSPAEIAKTLPEDWPIWTNPDCGQVEKEIKADPRWNAWVEKTLS